MIVILHIARFTVTFTMNPAGISLWHPTEVVFWAQSVKRLNGTLTEPADVGVDVMENVQLRRSSVRPGLRGFGRSGVQVLSSILKRTSCSG